MNEWKNYESTLLFTIELVFSLEPLCINVPTLYEVQVHILRHPRTRLHDSVVKAFSDKTVLSFRSLEEWLGINGSSQPWD